MLVWGLDLDGMGLGLQEPLLCFTEVFGMLTTKPPM